MSNELKPEWYDLIEKYCGDNGLNNNSAHDRWVAMEIIPENNKAICFRCKVKFDYAITGHMLKHSWQVCNKCYFLIVMNPKKRARIMSEVPNAMNQIEDPELEQEFTESWILIDGMSECIFEEDRYPNESLKYEQSELDPRAGGISMSSTAKNADPFTWNGKLVEFNCRMCFYPLAMKTFTNGCRKDIFDIEPCVNCLSKPRLSGIEDVEGLVKFVKRFAENGCTNYGNGTVCGDYQPKCDCCEALSLIPKETQTDKEE